MTIPIAHWMAWASTLTKVIDDLGVAQLVRDGAEKVKSLLATWSSSLPADMGALERLGEKASAAEIVAAAHTITSDESLQIEANAFGEHAVAVAAQNIQGGVRVHKK